MTQSERRTLALLKVDARLCAQWAREADQDSDPAEAESYRRELDWIVAEVDQMREDLAGDEEAARLLTPLLYVRPECWSVGAPAREEV